MVCHTTVGRSTPRCRRYDCGIGCSKRCGAHIAGREPNSQVCSQHHRGMCSPALNPLSSVTTLTLSLGAIRRDEGAFCTTFERVDFTTTREDNSSHGAFEGQGDSNGLSKKGKRKRSRRGELPSTRCTRMLTVEGQSQTHSCEHCTRKRIRDDDSWNRNNQKTVKSIEKFE